MSTIPHIPLDEDRGPSIPVLKRRRIGESFTGMLANKSKRQRRTNAGDLAFKADGSPSYEEVVTLVTIGGDMTCGVGDTADHQPAPGEVVRLIVKGGGYGAWIEAQKALGRGLQVGDVVQASHDRAVVYSMAGTPVTTYTTQAEVEAHRTMLRPGTLGIYGPIVCRGASAMELGTFMDAAVQAHYASKQQPIAPSSLDDDAPF